jgi:hypothetical protein
MKTESRLFHYTTASRLQKILRDNVIKQAIAFIDRRERPAVWFSYLPVWEPTATPAMVNKETGEKENVTFEQLIDMDSPSRIEVNPECAPMNWREWRRLSGIGASFARRLEEVAIRQGSDVTRWRISFEPVGIEHWLAIEMFTKTGRRWTPIEEVFPDSPMSE